MVASATSNFNLWFILKKENLNGTNFMDCYRNLRIVLRQEHKEFVLAQPFPADLPNNAPAAQRMEHEKRCNVYLDISYLMLATMSPELQRQYEALDSHTIITGLRNMFEDQARTESLEKLGFPLSRELATDLILQSLPPSFELFILNFNMDNMNRTLAELHGMLNTAEESIKKNSNHLIVMHKRKPNNKKSGQKRKLNSDEITSTSNSKTKVQKTGPAKDAECFFCKETGHWKIVPPQAPFTGQSERASELLALVYTDICGPMSSTARGSFGYFITFTDDFSRYGCVYLMRHKSESFEKFKEFQNEVQNNLGKTIKYLRSDRGGEYLSLEFGNHLKECGIIPQLTPPGTPQWNWVSEQRNRTLLDMLWKHRLHEGPKGYGVHLRGLRGAAYILGIRIYRERSKRLIGLSQSTYIDKLLKRFNMQYSKKGFLPMSHGINLGKNQCPQATDERNKMSVIPYASAIGCIMYAMLCTRPDVSYALSATSRYQLDPGESHWIAVKNILKYLRRTKDMFLVYGGQEELVVNGYTDASFQTDKDDFRSQSKFVFCLNGGAVSWKSSKQDTVADSTTEAEYIAASEAAKKAVWIKKFVSQLGVMTSASSPMDLCCDNSGAIAQAKEPRSHQKSKHILWRYHLIREIVGRGDVKICKIHTDLNVADR
uniref:Polyprotein n=1 Tax=Oryza sativa subsp. japonica TaxID=39947 RepID=Q84R90_ORYSJ|nr:putative polyprotein [Oryza sativa Japonica Group]